MAFVNLGKLLTLYIVFAAVRCEDDLEYSDSSAEADREMMVAMDSRQYQTFVKAPIRIVKPKGVTNSHRPQFDLDSFEVDYIDRRLKENEADVLIDFFDEVTTKKSAVKTYKPSFKFRSRESMIRDAVLRALERKDHVGKFAQIVPIIRSMSETQRIALASLVASQVSTPPGRSPLNLAQVRSMFGNNANTTSDLMLPILLDLANLIRRSMKSNKETREVKQPQVSPPKLQFLRRSFTENEDEDTFLDEEPFETGYNDITTTTTIAPTTTQTNTPQNRIRSRNTNRNRPQRVVTLNKSDKQDTERNNVVLENNTTNVNQNISRENLLNDNIINNEAIVNNNKSSSNNSNSATTTTSALSLLKVKPLNGSRNSSDNGSMDLTADSTNNTLSQDLPIAEKLRALNRFVDRKGNLIRRTQRPPIKPSSPVARRTTAESTLTPIRRRPLPARKLPAPVDQAKCELFTNSLCLHTEDYPTEAILQSIRRNKAAAGALLADFRDPGEGAVDGVSAAQEAKYTADHYLTSNRRGDTANRDFAGAGEAGFMCPSTVKYARPQRARATSGQWKYIVNTGEHTQTLRLEKCLKPKESCTYLTDNFKSKCVQVYNYHRLLTWDQQNGLHMDIFKVPTCCSCHIEGYSVSFPPLGNRVHESSSEQFPGEDLSSDHGNNAFESVQSSVQRPSITKKIPFSTKPLDNTFATFGDNHNQISGSGFANGKVNDNEDFNNVNIPGTGPMDSYGNNYFPDSFNQASSIRNVKRPAVRKPTPSSNIDTVTLPSYLEPPTPQSGSPFSFGNDKPNKYKAPNSHFKRGALRPSRRPIRKKLTTSPDDLMSSGTSAIESMANIDSIEDFNDEQDNVHESNTPLRVTTATKFYVTPPPKTYVEKSSTTLRPEQTKPITKDTTTSSGKRVNYNYHPIIEFFENSDVDDGDDDDSAMDRDDSETSFAPSPESEWKPINHPATRRTQTTNMIYKKHK